MVKEIKQNRLLIEFENIFHNETFTYYFNDIDRTVYCSTSGIQLITLKPGVPIRIYLTRIKECFGMDLSDDIIIKFLKDKYSVYNREFRVQ